MLTSTLTINWTAIQFRRRAGSSSEYDEIFPFSVYHALSGESGKWNFDVYLWGRVVWGLWRRLELLLPQWRCHCPSAEGWRGEGSSVQVILTPPANKWWCLTIDYLRVSFPPAGDCVQGWGGWDWAARPGSRWQGWRWSCGTSQGRWGRSTPRRPRPPPSPLRYPPGSALLGGRGGWRCCWPVGWWSWGRGRGCEGWGGRGRRRAGRGSLRGGCSRGRGRRGRRGAAGCTGRSHLRSAGSLPAGRWDWLFTFCICICICRWAELISFVFPTCRVRRCGTAWNTPAASTVIWLPWWWWRLP